METTCATRVLRALVASAACSLISIHGQAQDWPARAVKVIIPLPPGGSIDPLVRVVSRRLQQRSGQAFVIENRPGGASLIGAQAVLREPRDGYTLFAPGSSVATWRIFNKDAPVDLIKDFHPVTRLNTSSFAVVTHVAVPAKTLHEFIAYAKSNPAKMNYGSASGGIIMLSTEWFKQLAGINVVHVMYKGAADMRPALLENHIQLLFDNADFHSQQAKLGKVRILAVTTEKRNSMLPEVPTVAELGFPGFVAGSWTGVFVGSGTPREVIAKIYSTFAEAMNTDEYRDLLQKLGGGGYGPGGETPAEFERLLEAEMKTWEKVVRTAGIAAP